MHLLEGAANHLEGVVSPFFPASLSEQPVPGKNPPNVVCMLPGLARRPSWSGATTQSLARSSRKHTFVFGGFAGEERGLKGPEAYVDRLPKDQLANIEAMIDVDTLGLGPTKVWVNHSDPMLVSGLLVIAQHFKIPVGEMNVNGFGLSDEESFIEKKICTMTVHSVRTETAHILHTRDGNPAAIRWTDYYDSYQFLADYLAAFDGVAVPGNHACKTTPLG
jgi:hypothetical protein